MQLQLFNLPIHYNDYLYLLHKYDMLRKSQHARISGLQKQIKDLQLRLEILESGVCQGELVLQKAM